MNYSSSVSDFCEHVFVSVEHLVKLSKLKRAVK